MKLRSGNPSAKGFFRINRNIFVFLFFLLLSFIFWYLTSLSKEIDTTLKYPVAYANVPGGSETASNLPSKLNLMFKGHGYTILRIKLSAKGHPLTIDFSEISYFREQKNSSGNCYIVTAPLLTSFSSQLLQDARIISVKPDTIFFSAKQE